MSSDPFGDALRAQESRRKSESEQIAGVRESEQATIRDYERWLNELAPRFYDEARRRRTPFSEHRDGGSLRISMRRCWLIDVTSAATDSDGFPQVRMQFAVLSDGSWRVSAAQKKSYRSLTAQWVSVRQGLTYEDFARAFAGSLH
jgi:hypothetical protein